MKITKYWKIILPILFALAVLLGLAQRKPNPLTWLTGHTSITHFSDSGGSLEGYYIRGQELAKQQDQAQSATFLAVGDIMLSRNVAATIEHSGSTSLPFIPMEGILKFTDFNFGNLETPVAQSKAIVGGNALIFNSPQQYVAPLKDYGFKILNLANNHAFDQGLEGIDFTKTFLDSLGIAHEGTGDALAEAWKPAVVEANGIKICFVGASYASANDGGKTTNDYVARMEDTENLKLAIENSKSLCDFVVATMHGGVEYTRTPNDTQTTFAHTAIDDGADLVIGAHPHWAQTIEKYNNKYIFYSLGNFIFDQMFSQDTREGLTLKITLNKSASNTLQGPKTSATLDSIELMPVIIDNYSTPRPATAEETKKILAKIGETNTILK